MRSTLLILTLSAFIAADANGQGYGQPLTMQGLHRTSLSSVASRGVGGVTVGRTGDVSLMFSHPASLTGIQGMQITIGGHFVRENSSQRQQWYPMRILPTFSLMMEGLLDSIPDPDYTETPDDGFGPEDSIARPFDAIKPDWSKTRNSGRLGSLMIALPIEVAGQTFVAAAGMSEYADLSSTFLNNNVLSPSIGTQRPSGIPRPSNGQEIPVMWSRYQQTRKGSLMSYGAALSSVLTENLSVGVSGRVISGSTDDLEFSISRGRIRFGNNAGVYYYKLDNVLDGRWKFGVSKFSGLEFTISASYQSQYVDLGFTVRPPTSIDRSYTGTSYIDTTGSMETAAILTKDAMTLPWSGSFGLSIMVREDMRLGVEYEAKPYSEASYRSPSGEISSPWLSAHVFRAGAEYEPLPWLTLRAGVRRDAEVFEQEGNPIVGEGVRYTVLSLGTGISFFGAQMDISYERATVLYQDAWQTNVNLNRSERAYLVTAISYVIQ